MSEPAPETARATRRRFLGSELRGELALGDPFRPLEPDCSVLQFDHRLTPDQFRRAGALLAGRPDVELYVYGRAAADLDFLQHFPHVRRLHLALWELTDVRGLAAVAPQLEALTFGRTRGRFSLAMLAEARALRRLFLVGHDKDLAAVSGLTGLTSLGISGLTLPDLAVFTPLQDLTELQIMLGGTRNLALLPRFPRLERLWLMRITGLADLSVLAELPALAWLELDWMRNVTALPSFAPLGRLTEVILDTMKGLTDLAPVADAPALRRVSVTDSPQLAAEAFAVFQAHPSLDYLYARTGRGKVNRAVLAMFPGIAR